MKHISKLKESSYVCREKVIYTYIIKSKMRPNLVKIGRTTNPKSRFTCLKVEKYILLLGDVEAALHYKYRKYRQDGEWFNLDEKK